LFGKCVDLRRAILNAKSTIKLLIARKANINFLIRAPAEANLPTDQRNQRGNKRSPKGAVVEEKVEEEPKQIGLVDMVRNQTCKALCRRRATPPTQTRFLCTAAAFANSLCLVC